MRMPMGRTAGRRSCLSGSASCGARRASRSPAWCTRPWLWAETCCTRTSSCAIRGSMERKATGETCRSTKPGARAGATCPRGTGITTRASSRARGRRKKRRRRSPRSLRWTAGQSTGWTRSSCGASASCSWDACWRPSARCLRHWSTARRGRRRCARWARAFFRRRICTRRRTGTAPRCCASCRRRRARSRFRMRTATSR